MHIGRNLTSGGLGGLMRGAEIGLLEALFHIATSGAPDLWSPLYGIVLYALIGLPFGLVGGVLISIAEFGVRKSKWKVEPFLPYVAGEICTLFPILGFVLFYQANKVVYLEQGVPLSGLLAIVAILCIGALANLIVGRFAIKGRFKLLLKPIGTVGVLGLVALLALVVALLPLSPNPRRTFAADKPVPAALEDAPNVLFIMVDTLRADHLNDALAPNLAAIGHDGIVFEQAYAQASWTRSSGASLWTSRLPSGHNADTKAARLAEEAVTWAEVLQDAGVTTGALVNNINLTGSFGFDQGFDTFLYESPRYRFGGTESVFALTFYKVVHKVAEKVFGGHKDVTSYYQPARVVLSDAQSFIEANRDGRWALYAHLMEPHDPYFEHPALSDPEGADFNGVGFARAEVEHPNPEDADYLRQVYADEVRWMDREIAPFLEWLRAEGLYDDTLIVVTADHGEEFYEHGGWWHGTTLYDEQIHVPLLVKPPGDALAGTVVPWQVRNIDVAPTLAVAMGVAPDPSWAGEDLLGSVSDWLEAEAALEAAIYTAWHAEQPDGVPGENSSAPVDVRDEEPCFVWAFERTVVAEEDFEGNIIGAIRMEGMKLIRANAGNPRGLPTEELFEVRVDSGERSDLAEGGRPICSRYSADWSSLLGERLAGLVMEARQGGVDGGEVAMTRGECEALLALGYVEGCDEL